MILEVRGLSKKFGTKEDSLQALKDVNLQLNKGEILGVVGESGSGKTTLLKVISGLEVADQGEIKLHERLLTAKRTKEDYRLMQMIFQDAAA
ncbi:MAG: ATP-binding cassette domain-containing protein, partial [Lachnospiraceae bacterium]|nr:ATP-binding cassette domain-containing protein [Lachnospiraceae bacterium]